MNKEYEALRKVAEAASKMNVGQGEFFTKQEAENLNSALCELDLVRNQKLTAAQHNAFPKGRW